ncbi:MAG: NAD(P)-dependent oxidoreductase [Prolixibacteraceae bacterium]|jgi:dTDP-4-dehydrorhamnose reductase|nr:NAD(P)-dependent oxidoreductase [Prolixibacteraceae bacterium]
MRLLITGLNGFVAGSIVAQAKKTWEVHGVDITEATGLPVNVHGHQLDLMDQEKVATLFQRIRPDVVIHTAAMANIDVCENNKELAWKVNVGITEIIAEQCKTMGIKMIVCSTDTVFDGIKGHYSETDTPFAVNHYAKTKIEAERIVLEASSKNIVARLSLVMGLPVMGKGNSFLAEIIEKLKRGETVKFPENEIRTPIDVVTLGAALTELAGSDFGGIIHLSGNTRINRYKMAIHIAEMLGYDASLVEGTNSNALAGRAPRPNDASMENGLAKSILQTPMLTLDVGLNLTLNFKIEEI